MCSIAAGAGWRVRWIGWRGESANGNSRNARNGERLTAPGLTVPRGRGTGALLFFVEETLQPLRQPVDAAGEGGGGEADMAALGGVGKLDLS